MPLCPQITITPVTVTSTNMTQTSVIAANAPATTEQLTTVSDSVAAALAAAAAADAAATAAQADADAAQAAAAAAQAEADTAYDTAVAANTAASTAQATANGKNKVTYSTSAPGSTANTAGDIWFQYGTTSPNVGRIIAQYMGAGGTSWTSTTVSGLVIANIDAGSITTGTLSVALGITGTSGNFSVNAVTGALNATSATIKGQVSATSGYFGTDTNGYSITSTGLVGIGTGVIIGGQIQTSSGSTSVGLIGSTNSLSFKNGGSYVGHLVPLSSNGILMHYGAAADGSGGTFPQVYVSGSNALLAASNSVYVSANSGGLGIQMQGNVSINSTLTYDGAATASGSTLVLVTTGRRVGYVSSSRATKKNIEPLATVGFVDKLLTLEPVAFDWKDQPEDMPYRRNYGLIAEDVAALGGELESIVNYNADNEPVSISYDRLSTFLISAVKELKAEIELLKGA